MKYEVLLNILVDFLCVYYLFFNFSVITGRKRQLRHKANELLIWFQTETLKARSSIHILRRYLIYEKYRFAL